MRAASCPALPALTWVSAFFLLFVTFPCQGWAQRELIIVSPHWEGIQFEFTRAFENHHRKKTGETVRLRWRDLGGTSQIEKAINSLFEINPETAGIDVFFGGGIDPFESQKARGQLAPFRLPEEVLAALPREVGGFPIVDEEFMFYGSALSSFGILENRRVVKILGLPPVKTWEDLCDPRLFSWVSSTDLRKSGAAHMIYEIILQAYGWERGWAIIYQSSGNVRQFEQSSSGPTKQVSLGEAAYALAIDINGMTQQAFLGVDNVKFSIPTGVSVINPDGIAILRGAPNRDLAEAFVTFVMSREGQALWMTPTGQPGGAERFGISRMGVLPELYENDLTGLLVPANPFEAEFSFRYDTALGSRRWSLVNSLMGQTIIDVHPHLVRAWRAILDVPEGERESLLERFSEPFISETESAELAAIWNRDKLRAGQLSNRWMQEAVARFRRLEREARTAAAGRVASP
ncbi:MAG: extracellular solute-binding protein [Verrucomicrobiia bacterium]